MHTKKTMAKNPIFLYTTPIKRLTSKILRTEGIPKQVFSNFLATEVFSNQNISLAEFVKNKQDFESFSFLFDEDYGGERNIKMRCDLTMHIMQRFISYRGGGRLWLESCKCTFISSKRFYDWWFWWRYLGTRYTFCSLILRGPSPSL